MFGLGAGEIALIVAVIVLLFGASKLPELARGTGRALRIFKTETKGLLEDDSDVKDDDKHPAEKEIEARNAAAREADVEATREQHRDTSS